MYYGNYYYVSVGISVTLALVAFFLYVMRRRRSFISKFADKSLLASIAPSASLRRKIIKMSFIVIAVFFGIFSMARPQWGFEWEEAKRTGLDMLIAIDVSKSMLATDVKPNRLERSKFAVKDLIKKLNGDRMRLIVVNRLGKKSGATKDQMGKH